MKSANQNAAHAFGLRLRELMQARGMTSPGNRSGVDVAKLAEVASTSYEMARRYAEGAAIPRPGKLAAIARWLGVSPAELNYGDPPKAGAIDEKVLQECIEAIAAAQETTGRTLSTEKAAHLVALLYQEAQAGELPALESIALLVRASA